MDAMPPVVTSRSHNPLIPVFLVIVVAVFLALKGPISDQNGSWQALTKMVTHVATLPTVVKQEVNQQVKQVQQQAKANGLITTHGSYGFVDLPAGWAAALPPAARPFVPGLTSAAKAHDIDPRLLAALVQDESGYQPTVCSNKGACGLTQLMPLTAQSLGVTDRMDPTQNLNGGARYLRAKLDEFGGRLDLALAAYNAGPTVTKRCGCIPNSTAAAYVHTVETLFVRYGGRV